MKATVAEQDVQTLHIVKETAIDAPVEVVWESVIEEMTTHQQGGSGPMPMKLEAWPGGRWYRDLGNSAGHLWAHVQVIKPPKLLELCGPLFMSYPAVSHVQYKLAGEDGSTRLKLTHRAIGLIDPEHAAGVQTGWGSLMEAIRKNAERRAAGK
jgi:uncharacterized protein YndB with AHSA1/START domain